MTCKTFFLAAFLFGAALRGAAQDMQHYTFALTLSDTTNRIHGVAAVTVRFNSARTWFRLDLAGRMRVSSVREGRKKVPFLQDAGALSLRVKARKRSRHTYRIVYAGTPSDGLIISTNKYGSRTFFGDNWPDRAHQWLPCVDRPGDKAGLDFIVTAPDHYRVIAPGIKTEDVLLSEHLRRTHWVEKVPVPTKVMVIGVAEFAISPQVFIQGIPVNAYVFPQNRERGFRDYAWADSILPFYIRKVGPYAYEKLANVQSKTIFGGMENASAIFYSETSVGSRGVEELMAHEIAHQWFGDAVTETDYRHLWLSEGFATYMTHLYMEDRYGPDTLRKGMAADRKTVLVFARRQTIPVVDTGRHGGYMQLLNANSYQKGGWVLHMLRRSVGDSLFWAGIRRYFATYDGRNASTDSFRLVMETVCARDLGPFFTQWLYTPGVPRLRCSWASADGGWTLQVEQLQEQPFVFTLEYSIDGVVHTLGVKDRVSGVRLPDGVLPEQVRVDPDVDLLADIQVVPPEKK
ncbi:M1 family metallopeptidase [Dinghuibacter silviterrae]|uniref:Aminopeptidase N n=1 Tax=Dinghuibacter silviterrae TaxID=1539049 RepID=A0A4R8DR46_9BACT|nr:M1 family metallopeptidase [Dinghuibacter silviterrae]TDX00296.1 peptidase M1-like protein [Dinghuibacter silviterrae]